MAHAHHLPRRIHQNYHVDVPTSPLSSSQKVKLPVSSTRRLSDADGRSLRAVINYRMFSCISTILDLSVRMPWLASSLGFWQHLLSGGLGRYGAPNSTLDKFLHHTISTRVFSPSLLPPLLLQVRTILFPNNTLGPAAPPPPSPDEALQIRRKAASNILSLIPKSMARTFFAINGSGVDENGQGKADSDEEMISEIEDRIMGWTDDVELNKYLIYAILEHVVVKLVPEIRWKTPTELLAERGVDLTGDSGGIEARSKGGAEKSGILDG